MLKDLNSGFSDGYEWFLSILPLVYHHSQGLTKTVFPEQAESFSVVSNGAECIMISKKFFLEKATEATMHHLRQVVSYQFLSVIQNGIVEKSQNYARNARLFQI